MSSSEIAQLWELADARMNAGEPKRREAHLPYSMAPGDGEISSRLWLTESEADRLHTLTLALPSAGQEAYDAKQRLIVKIIKRRILQLSIAR